MPGFKKDILALRAQGFSYNKIVAQLGCSKATISYHCTKEGCTPLVIPTLPIPEQKQDFLEWLLKEGVCKKNISDVLGLPYSLVLSRARGLPNPRELMSNYDKVRLRRRHLKMLATVHFGGKCELCGYSRSLRALSFHHKDPSLKEFTISQVTSRSWESIKAELDKCVMLCANCHQEQHDPYFSVGRVGLEPTTLSDMLIRHAS